jgi:phosphotransacetylase
MTAGLEPIRTAIVDPVDSNALHGAVEAAQANLIIPIMIGLKDRILAVAAAHNVDVSPYSSSQQNTLPLRQIKLLVLLEGEVDAVMKGTLHTDELMHSVLAPRIGLSTERRISHVFVLDVPAYPRMLFLTDASLNIYPELEEKRDIVQNAIDLAHVVGIGTPRVALVSAVIIIDPKIHSTLEAAALCKMVDRGQISGGLVDGTLAFDNAVSFEAARTKGIVSPVASQADILVVPDLESGNMLAKQLEYLADAQTSGIVLGARMPIMLTSRAVIPLAHIISCTIALLLARSKQAAKL